MFIINLQVCVNFVVVLKPVIDLQGVEILPLTWQNPKDYFDQVAGSNSSPK